MHFERDNSFKSIRVWFASFDCTNSFFEGKITYLPRKGARIMNNFCVEEFSFWKLQMEMILASMDLWDH